MKLEQLLKLKTKFPTVNVHAGQATATDGNVYLSAPCDLPDGAYEQVAIKLWRMTGAIPTPVDPFDMPEMGDTLATIQLDAVHIHTVSHAMAKYDVHYYLSGFCLSASGDLVATDGHRMVVVQGAFDSIENGVIVPQEAVKYLPKKGTLTASIYMSWVVFEGMGLTCRIIEGRYPDYKRVIPDKPRLIFPTGIDRAIVKKALDVAKVSGLDMDAVPLWVENGKASIGKIDLGETGMFGDCPACFSVKYLHEAIDGQIEYRDEKSSILIRNGNTIEVIAPLRGGNEK